MQIFSRSLFFSAVTLLTMLLAQPLWAARVENMFSAEVAVQDSSEEAREAGIKEALAQVLVRVTGTRAAALRPELLDLSERAASFVQAYRYRRSGPGLYMWVTFDGGALQQQVARAGVPVWGPARPAILVWLAIDYGGGKRSVVAADSDGAAARAIRAAAVERGLPVSLPLMDAQDRERVSFADIWGGFAEAVEAASSRYAPDALLLGRARRLASGQLSIEWRLEFAAEVVSERGGLGDGIEIAADYFARQFAVGGEAGTGLALIIEVSDLVNLPAYARVLEHLTGLSVIDHVLLSRMAGDSAFFELRLRGSREQLRRALALGGVLQERRLEPLQNSSGMTADLLYRPAP